MVGLPPVEGSSKAILLIVLNLLSSSINSLRVWGISKSLLDQISGIGRSRKRALLHHFGSAKSVESASFEDLKSVDGIEEKVAKKIHDFFHEG